ncbi:M1 family metallopeptidase [soil metagenome]
MRNWKTAVAAAALILGAGLAAPLTANAQTEATAAADAREILPTTARPERYGITLTPDVATMTFQGQAKLTFEVVAPTDRITVNAQDLTFASARLDGNGAAARIEADGDLTRVSFIFDTPLPVGSHTIDVAYAGKINQTANGLFASTYQDGSETKTFLITQFEAGYARQIAPLWDEPGLKAVFDLAMVVPEGQDVVSNMPPASTTPVEGGLKKVAFEPTPRMSTYLMFFGMGELDRITTQVGGVEIGTVSRRGAGEQGRYALDALSNILPFYNDYFGTPYPLPKLDQVAAPGSGTFIAMENWGGILYFEQALLVDPALATESDRQAVYNVIAHEVAHQWFGDLVTMSWWNDLWLNEGFASWMENKAVDQFNPDWNIWLQTQSSVESAMALDALSGTHPIIQPIASVEEAETAFDQITYQKGQAVIRMLESYLGEDDFRDGVRRYMAAHAYQNTVTEDLWSQLDAASGKPVSAIARDFTTQPGIPLIIVDRVRCEAGSSVVSLTQGRFGADEASKAAQTWRVPVLVQTVGSGRVASTVIEGGQGEVTAEGCGPVKVNAGNTGYFRTVYPQVQFEALEGAFGSLAPLDQRGLLNDSWALGAAGYAPMSNYLGLTDRVRADADPVIWSQVASTLDNLEMLYDGQPGEADYDAFARERLSPMMTQVDWEARTSEPANAAILRERLITVLSNLDDPAVIAEARRRYAASANDPSALPAGVRQVVLNTVGAHADAATWEDLLARADAAQSPVEKSGYRTAMALAMDPVLAGRTLDLIFGGDIPPQEALPMLFSLTVNNAELLWRRSIADQAVYDQLLPPPYRVLGLASIAGATRSPERIAEMRSYVAAHYPGAPTSEIEKASAAVDYAARIRRERLPDVTTWLEAH